MNIDSLLEMSSSSHKSDKSLEYKAKIKNIVEYLGERKSAFDTDEKKEIDYDTYFEPDSEVSTIPYQGKKLEGLKVCMSVISGIGDYDWERLRFKVQKAFDELSELKFKEAKDLRHNLVKNVAKVKELFNKHEDGANLSDSEKQKIIDFASDCSYMMTIKDLKGTQDEYDNNSNGASGGLANIMKANNMIPCKFNAGSKTFKGIIVAANKHDSRGTIVWVTDKSMDSDASNSESLARTLWSNKVKSANLDPDYEKRFLSGSIRLVGFEGSYTVDINDAKVLRGLGFSFNDSDEAKKDLMNHFVDTYEKMRDKGIFKGSSGKYGDDILRYLSGWQEVMNNYSFWQGVNI